MRKNELSYKCECLSRCSRSLFRKAAVALETCIWDLKMSAERVILSCERCLYENSWPVLIRQIQFHLIPNIFFLLKDEWQKL